MKDKDKNSLTPHDELFKYVWGKEENARNFFENYLPAGILSKLNLKTIEVQQGSFVDENLKAHHSDLLYKVKTLKNEAYIYILFEHKSYEDLNIHLQLLRYMTNIWTQNFKESKKLSPILPLVLYHGKKSWTVPVLFSELFKSLDDFMRPYFPDFSYHLYDLSHYDDEEIRGDVITQAVMLIFKYIFRAELKEKLPGILRLLSDLAKSETGLNYIKTLLKYASSSKNFASNKEFYNLIKKGIENLENKEGENIMAYAKSLLERNYDEGMEKGILRGLEKGRLEGLRYSIIDLFELRFEGHPFLILLKDKVENIRELERLEEIRSFVKKCKDPEEVMEMLKS